MPEFTQRYDRTARRSSHQWVTGSSTRSTGSSARRGSTMPLGSVGRDRYSSRPSVRLMICDETTTGVGLSSTVTS